MILFSSVPSVYSLKSDFSESVKECVTRRGGGVCSFSTFVGAETREGSATGS